MHLYKIAYMRKVTLLVIINLAASLIVGCTQQTPMSPVEQATLIPQSSNFN